MAAAAPLAMPFSNNCKSAPSKVKAKLIKSPALEFTDLVADVPDVPNLQPLPFEYDLATV